MRYAALVSAALLAIACTATRKPPDNPLAREARPAFEDTVTSEGALAVEKGARAVRAGQYERAILHLGPLAHESPISRHPTYGSAATWLGRAFLGRGNTTQARNVWLLGLRGDRRAKGQSPPADAADAYLRSLSPSDLRDSPGLATEVFFRLLLAMGASETATADTTLRRHAAQLALIVPDSMAGPLSAYASPDTSVKKAAPASREVLGRVAAEVRRWFEAQDPILGTDVNERVVEHLVRVRTAQQKYSWRGRPSGLDDRGETYVRYGPPERSMSVTREATSSVSIGGDGFNDPILLPRLRVALNKLFVPRLGFPAAENEAWAYPELEPPLHFIFVKSEREGKPYLEGTAQDLLPFEVRRSPRRDESAAHLAVYNEVYRQLSRLDRRYANRHSRILSYSALSDGSLRTFASFLTSQGKAEDWQIQREQKEAPKQKTQADLSHPSMPVAVRTARFLEEDGTTRTEVYWGIRPDSLDPPSGWLDNSMKLGFEPSGSYLVQATGVLRARSLRTESKATRLDTVSVQDVAEGTSLSPPPLVLREGDGAPADSHWVALEWTQRAIGTDGQPGFYVHASDKTLGPQPALSADPGGLEMSDVRLVSMPEEGTTLPESEAATRRRTVPFGRIKADGPIVLNFEVYHLAFGPEDRTRYTVEYTADYETEAGGLAGLFGATEQQSTSTSSTYRGSERRTSEYNLLELSEMEGLSGPTPVTITVRVTDEVTGRSAERSISFTLVPPTSS